MGEVWVLWVVFWRGYEFGEGGEGIRRRGVGCLGFGRVGWGLGEVVWGSFIGCDEEMRVLFLVLVKVVYYSMREIFWFNIMIINSYG